MTEERLSKKKLKAWFVTKRKKRDLLMYHHQEARDHEAERQQHQQTVMAPKRQEKAEEEPVWSARTQEIRNRLTDKKRMASERWNRFAATEDAGGRGL